MNTTDINQVLTQMRILRDQSRSTAIQPQNSVDFSALLKEATPAQGTADFSSLLKDSIDKVNDAQLQAGKLAEDFDAGTTDASLAEVMISLQKASVSFQAMTQVRNKLVEAYKDVMNMPM
jgi:flagellar hook-basal body complex protein FliE